MLPLPNERRRHRRDRLDPAARVAEARGQAWTDSFAARTEESPYGRRRSLRGIADLVTYWTEYQVVTGAFYQSLSCAKVKIEGSQGEWHDYQERLRQFFDLSPMQPARRPEDDLRRFVGGYTKDVADDRGQCDITLVDGELYLSGLPELWPRNRLIPVDDLMFRLASFPCEVSFMADASGIVRQMRVRGEELLSGSVDWLFTSQ